MDGYEVTRSDVNLGFAVLFYKFNLNKPKELGKFSSAMYVSRADVFRLARYSIIILKMSSKFCYLKLFFVPYMVLVYEEKTNINTSERRNMSVSAVI
jgi:hypothetical protein